jgi:hypothetical protein
VNAVSAQPTTTLDLRLQQPSRGDQSHHAIGGSR